MSLLLTEKLIQRQINHWNRLREILHDDRDAADPPPGPVITVSRLTGAGGRSLALALCERLGLRLHDQSLIETVARNSRLDPELVRRLDEHDISQTDLWVRGVLEQRIVMKEQYRRALTETVEELAAAGDAVFLGRGANHILGQRATLRVRLVAGHNQRLARMQDRLDLSRAEARALLAETDRQRHEFVHKVFNEDAHLPDHYDLVLNTDRLYPAAVLEIVLLAVLETRSPGHAHQSSAV